MSFAGIWRTCQLFLDNFQERPNTSQRFQAHPNVSQRIREGPNRSKHVSEPTKTSKNLRKLRRNFAETSRTSRACRRCFAKFLIKKAMHWGVMHWKALLVWGLLKMANRNLVSAIMKSFQGELGPPDPPACHGRWETGGCHTPTNPSTLPC